MIQKGIHYLSQSMKENKLTAYHIEANIAAQHCMAHNFEDTDWKSIYDNYQLLEQFKPNPIIKLNLAIIQSKLIGLEPSLKLLEELEKVDALKNYHLLQATQGIFLFKLNRKKEAKVFLEKALTLNPSQREREYIISKLEDC